MDDVRYLRWVFPEADFNENPLPMIGYILVMCVAAIVLIPGGVILGSLLTAAVLAWFAERELWSKSEIELRADHAAGIMLGLSAMTLIRFPKDDASGDDGSAHT